MHNSLWRTHLAILWLLQVANYVALILITQIESGMFGTLEAGSNATVFAVFLFLPCLLAWLSFVSRQSLIRWGHIVFGILYAAIKLVATVGGLTDGESFAYVFNEVWGLIAAGLIVWFAWRSPKELA